MWRARGRYCSTYRAPLPKALVASERQRSNVSASSLASWTARVPRPPPPASALSMTAPPAPRPARKVGRLLLRDRAVDAGDRGHVRLGRRRAGPALVAEQLEVRDARPDEGDAGVRAGPGEAGVLGQEAVAGVDRVAAGGHGRRHDRLDVEVGRHAAGVEPDGLVGDARVQRLGVVLRVDGHAADAEVGRRAGDANRDLAAVGDQQAADGHGASPGRRFRRLRESLAARPPADGQAVGAARYAPSSMAVANVTWNGTQ